MDNVFAFVRLIFREHETATIIFFVGIAGLLVFTLVNELSNAHRARRARRPPKENPTPKFGPNTTLPGTPGDEIAQRDRDLEKWREQHKAHFEQ
jgi:hypothetical protein